MRFSRRVSFVSLLLVALVCPATPQQPRLAPDKQTMPLIGIVTNQALAQESGCRFAKQGETPDVKYIFISESGRHGADESRRPGRAVAAG
jgi:hypothetical protein